MKEHKIWHEQDEFWAAFAPFMFSAERITRTPVEVDQILEMANINPGARILDMGCGPGRHSLEFARRGYSVTGVDRTGYYLEMAREKAAEERLAVEFIQDDMRNFRRRSSFDVVLSMYTTFGYFEDAGDNLKVLANIFESLTVGGRLLIEMMGKEVLARIFVERNWVEQEGVFLLEERKIINSWNMIENRWILLYPDRRLEYQLSHWLYSSSEITAMLAEVGFHEIDIYGGIDGSSYDTSASRLVTLARKLAK